MAAADRACEHQSGIAFRLERFENRASAFEILFAAAHHKRVSAVNAPYAAGNTAIHEMDAPRLKFGRVARVIGVTGIAAIDDHVAGLQQLRQFVDGAVGRLACGHHHPHDARRGERCHHLFEACHGAIRFGGAVVSDHLVSGRRDALRHIATHSAQTDHCQLHDVLLSTVLFDMEFDWDWCRPPAFSIFRNAEKKMRKTNGWQVFCISDMFFQI